LTVFLLVFFLFFILLCKQSDKYHMKLYTGGRLWIRIWDTTDIRLNDFNICQFSL